MDTQDPPARGGVLTRAEAAGKRLLTGYRPTGPLHIGHLFGNILNNVALQETNDCFFLVADWHMLTDGYEDTSALPRNVGYLVADLIAGGIDPARSPIYRQSELVETAELMLFLSMVTPVSWLERNPTHKEQLRELAGRDIATYGFLGYPVLQAADILIVHGEVVPIGEDQLPHLEITREIVRRFNTAFGAYFPEPHAVLSEATRVPGTDGRKMSKSFGNAIFLTDTPAEVAEKTRKMITDPQKIRKNDPGRPEICDVFSLHTLVSGDEVPTVAFECRAGLRGCVDCKMQLAGNLSAALAPIQERRAAVTREIVGDVLASGLAKAKPVAEETMEHCRKAIRLVGHDL